MSGNNITTPTGEKCYLIRACRGTKLCPMSTMPAWEKSPPSFPLSATHCTSYPAAQLLRQDRQKSQQQRLPESEEQQPHCSFWVYLCQQHCTLHRKKGRTNVPQIVLLLIYLPATTSMPRGTLNARNANKLATHTLSLRLSSMLSI